MAETRTIIVNGKTHTLEERLDGAEVEVIQRDETGHVVAWYRRKAAPDAATPMMPSPSQTVRLTRGVLGRPMDRGPWSVHARDDGGFELWSDDFEHDAKLRISGDFDGNAREYAEALAAQLNAASGVVTVHALDSIDRAMAFEAQARDAFERKYRRDSRDPSAAADFDLFLEGYIACGVEGRSK